MIAIPLFCCHECAKFSVPEKQFPGALKDLVFSFNNYKKYCRAVTRRMDFLTDIRFLPPDKFHFQKKFFNLVPKSVFQ